MRYYFGGEWKSIFAAAALSWAPIAAAQTSSTTTLLPLTSDSRTVEVYNVNVLDPTADRVRAAGQYAESIGNYLKKVAEARLIETQAERARLENLVKKFETRQQIREIRWQSKEDQRDRTLESRLNTFERHSRVLLELPGNIATSATASSLNAIFDRLTLKSHTDISETTAIELPPRTFDEVCLWYGVKSNKAKFLLNGTDQYVYEPPAALNKDPFQQTLSRYRDLRAKIIAALGTPAGVDDADIDKALHLIDELDQAYFETIPEKWKSNADKRYVEFTQVRQFLNDQTKQLGLLAVAKHSTKPFTGKTVQELVLYMRMNGYRFAKAERGGENTYYALFQALQQLLVKLET